MFQICSYFDSIFPKYQCGFRQELSAQYSLKKWKKATDECKALLTGLSKVFDCIPHALMQN